MDIAEISRLPLKDLSDLLASHGQYGGTSDDHPEKALVVQRIVEDMSARLEVLLDLGLGYLTPERSTPTLSPGELQRLRLATQVRSNLFGVVYVLDEPSAGLHPADTEALLRALDRLKASGNSLFVVEHELASYGKLTGSSTSARPPESTAARSCIAVRCRASPT
jgi:excinuclease ABC subunit A